VSHTSLKSLKRNSCIVETAGLPGSGKTTTLGILASRVGQKSVLQTKSIRSFTRKSRLNRLLYPVTLYRFRKLFRILYKANSDRGGFPWWCLSLLRKAGFKPAKGEKAVCRAVEILTYLNEFAIEYFVVRLTGRLSGRPVVVDEGYLQRGIGVWLRAPESLRETLSAAFLSSVPASVRCMVFDCEPERALQHCLGRSRGARAVEKWIDTSGADAEALSGSYKRLARLLSEHVITKFDCEPLSADSEPEQICSKLVEHLENIRPVDSWLIHLRN